MHEMIMDKKGESHPDGDRRERTRYNLSPGKGEELQSAGVVDAVNRGLNPKALRRWRRWQTRTTLILKKIEHPRNEFDKSPA